MDAICYVCGKQDHLLRCTACAKRKYCSRDCQRAHWRAGHKEECKLLQAHQGCTHECCTHTTITDSQCERNLCCNHNVTTSLRGRHEGSIHSAVIKHFQQDVQIQATIVAFAEKYGLVFDTDTQETCIAIIITGQGNASLVFCDIAREDSAKIRKEAGLSEQDILCSWLDAPEAKVEHTVVNKKFNEELSPDAQSKVEEFGQLPLPAQPFMF